MHILRHSFGPGRHFTLVHGTSKGTETGLRGALRSFRAVRRVPRNAVRKASVFSEGLGQL